MTIDDLTKNDPVLYADMKAYLLSGEWEIEYDSPAALWIRWKRGWLHALAAFDPAEARRLLGKIPPEDAVVLRGCSGLRELAAELGFDGCHPCVQVAYEEKTLLPVHTELSIRHPDERDFPAFAESYEMGGADEKREDFTSPDFLGAYLGDEFVGYIGVHGEGSMGMLYVFPSYRRRGYAEALCGTLINNQLRKGRLPFAQILADNTKSLRLQRKMGARFSDGLLYWMWRNK